MDILRKIKGPNLTSLVFSEIWALVRSGPVAEKLWHIYEQLGTYNNWGPNCLVPFYRLIDPDSAESLKFYLENKILINIIQLNSIVFCLFPFFLGDDSKTSLLKNHQYIENYVNHQYIENYQYI